MSSNSQTTRIHATTASSLAEERSDPIDTPSLWLRRTVMLLPVGIFAGLKRVAIFNNCGAEEMRTKVAATRFATAVIVMIALGVAGLIAGGPAQAEESPVAKPAPSEPAGAASRAFVMHETPQPVPELSFVNEEGKKLSLADFRGRTILLNIWATWCLPCRREMSALDRLQAKLGGGSFEVVPLSIDRDGLPKVKAFYEELGLKSLGIYVDASGRAAYRVGAFGIPTSLLIDPEGLEAGRLAGEAEWNSPELVTVIQQQLNKAAGTAD